LRANAFAGDACGVYQIVAAAGGEVMMVVENNDQSCSGCGEFNNYVWIKHANDEWTKYTHFTQNSVAVNVGDIVNAGDFLGTECWVGSTSPAQYRHLHFELRRPNDPANPVIDEAGGFMDAADGAHLIPVFNNFGKHFLEEGDQPANLNTTCTDSEIALIIPFVMSSGGISVHMSSASITTINNVPIIFSSGSNGMFHAGNLITLSPGFTAAAGSYFHARIGSCTPAGN